MATVNFIPYKRQSGGALTGVKRYIEQDEKTFDESLGKHFISGQNCSPQFADREFLATRTMYHKKSPVWFYHYTQSFHPDEPITGEKAHEIAKEFAQKAWADSEVLIATHIDANHIHSHFLINSVCYKSGKMLRQGPNTLKQLRKISDEICLAHQLSVLPSRKKEIKKGMTGREYRSAVKGESWKFRLINTIDECMRYAKTQEEFLRLMRDAGYEIRWTDSRKNITYTTPEGKKCRDDKLHSEKYLKEAMEREFRIRAEIVYGGIESAESPFDVNRSIEDSAAIPHRERMEGTNLPNKNNGTAFGGTDSPFDGFVEADGTVAHTGADEGCRGRIDGGTGGTDTGWEEEREILFSAENTPTEAAQTVASQAIDRLADHPVTYSDLLSDVIYAGHVLEQIPDDTPVEDMTTTPTRIDKKAWQKKMEKRRALGYRGKGHEEENKNFSLKM